MRCYIDQHIGLYVYVPELPAHSHLDFNDVPNRIFRMTSSMKLQHLGYPKSIANRVARVQILHEATAFAGPEALNKLIRRRGNDAKRGRALWPGLGSISLTNGKTPCGRMCNPRAKVASLLAVCKAVNSRCSFARKHSRLVVYQAFLLHSTSQSRSFERTPRVDPQTER